MSSISAAAFQNMPAATVNALSSDQLNGLTSSQVAALQNSPNYSSFSTNIKNGLTAVASNTIASNSVPIYKTSGAILNRFNLITLSMCFILSVLID